ncbi:Malonyl CoA-acyl carrier protein transacylase [Hartmannibacter diazotrophicus]|uniref:Malonyl CoA-acyl carrier protein transacylase n=1 Tax=Hartmannibacter diazotrophicus TaxID=1482074 RepID=A0A2C9D1K4_9HYPH|nr:malonate decarboxylase subunit epsilon [Hartmannibacter diazotrophicus]SON54038.1 Malonyl CoA-acyl carrier protein transacylase [Hartmannibacter diazotrophicus]
MTRLAVLCSGQGGQGPGMFDAIADAPQAGPVFARAARALGGQDPRRLVSEAQDRIHENAVAQILCATVAMAWWAILAPHVGKPLAVAGYSAGELPAWGVAGVLDVDEVFRLVELRAEAMDRASVADAGLGAVKGLPRKDIDALCQRHGVYVAIVVGPFHFVLGGMREALAKALGEADAHGASRCERLPVRVPSHTPLLSAAASDFAEDLRHAVGAPENMRDVRLVSGLDGSRIRDMESGKSKLAAQIAATVEWSRVMDALRAAGTQTFLELGPGSALSNMAGEFAPELPSRSTAQFRTIEGVRMWLQEGTRG